MAVDHQQHLEHSERIVVLETELLSVKVNQKDTNDKLDQILHEMTRYKGFLGGVTFLIGGVGMLWGLLHTWVERHWQ
jgi:hypothetical protein